MKAYLLTLFSALISLTTLYAQVPGAVIDVHHYRFAIQLSDDNDQLHGQAGITFRLLKATSFIDLDLENVKASGKGMTVTAVTENGHSVKFKQDTSSLRLFIAGAKGTDHTVEISYHGVPADGLIISKNKYGDRTFFGDNWPNRAHNWLPCIDNPADKASVEFIVTAPVQYGVVANGLKTDEKLLPGNLKITHWVEQQPISTKIMVIGMARFAIDRLADVRGIPLYTYVFPQDSAQGFKAYAVAKSILPYYIDKVGPYDYEKLANVQSKTIFGGMENAGCIFYYEASVGSKGIEELMAHEIAHQWFGDAASEKSFAHLWLSEGFATFMTNVYLEHQYGTDTLRKRLMGDRAQVLAFEKKRMTPVTDTAVKNNYMQLLNANSYQKGGWVLQMLRLQLGEEPFWKSIRSYYSNYRNGNANTADLQREMEQASGQKLGGFFKQWIYTAGTPDLEISWSYNAQTKAVEADIIQQQATLFSFPLTIAVNGQSVTIPITQTKTRLTVPVSQSPITIIADPRVELLARFSLKQAIN